MIKASFFYSEGQLNGFELKGHADSGEYGQDIVCAAVSALAISTINGLEQLAKVQLYVDANEQNGGFLQARLADSAINDEAAQLLLTNFRLGIGDVTKNYSDYIEIIEDKS
ncbi:ribosomal-processing cysteine protease Prp [Liquorilactobacillus hordei]|uniref:ribosomal-processing cysteine protease Prp n=1 Tax=Liquorilactobacillus hordei TaxID=468911 RepID=UPI001CBF3C52|nr:ribosomal-processing cysteine protease Prp [Liquorilactobacillus hordei]MBZ2404801.1 ribosomal-processing cysteine protease Prp [Liquorilactobacillus hordei]